MCYLGKPTENARSNTNQQTATKKGQEAKRQQKENDVVDVNRRASEAPAFANRGGDSGGPKQRLTATSLTAARAS